MALIPPIRARWSLFALACALSACSDPYGPLCVAFCSDSTHLQRQYADHRDECRQLAELKLNTMPTPGSDAFDPSPEDRAAKSRLVGMFSECMNTKAWAVPGPAKDDGKKDKEKEAALAASAAAGRLEIPAPAPAAVQDAERRRAADCAFARQSADASIIAKKRAEACEIECAQQRRLAPEAPKPAACE
jgi:hypothetical protein